MRGFYTGKFLFACLALLSCGGDEWHREHYANAGKVRVRSEADGAVTATVVFTPCLSSSCSRLRSAGCTISVHGNELRLESSAEIDERGGVCTDDCRKAEATCQTPPLDAGEYELVHGDTSVTLLLPAPSTLVIDQDRGG